MSLLNDVLKDLDARQSQRSSEVPPGLSGTSPVATGVGPAKRWLGVACIAVALAGAGWWVWHEKAVAESIQEVPITDNDASEQSASTSQAEPVQSLAASPAPVVPATPEADTITPSGASSAEDGVQSEPVKLADLGTQALSATEKAAETGVKVQGDEAEVTSRVGGSPEQKVAVVGENRRAGSAASVQAEEPTEAPRQVTESVALREPPKSSLPSDAHAGAVGSRQVATARLSKAPVRTPELEARDILDKARAVKRSDPEQARRILEAGLARLPGQTVLREALVRDYAESREFDRAHTLILAAPRPLSTPLLGLRGWIEQQMGEAAASVATYSELLRREPDNARWWSGLAIGLERNGQMQQARRAWEQVVALPQADARLMSWARQRLAALRAGES